MSRCLRYLPGPTGATTGPIGTGAATSSTSAWFEIPFQAVARIAPAGIVINTPGNLGIYQGSTLVAAVTALTIASASLTGVVVVATVASGLTANVAYTLNATTALAGNLLITGSEL